MRTITGRGRLTRVCAATITAATIAVVGIAVTAAPAAASASTTAAATASDDTLDTVKAALTARIDMRLASLNRGLAAITASRLLTDAHESELSALVNEAIAGLTALKGTVAGETTLAALRADAASMVNDYRVYKLVGPQVRLTIAGDAAAAAIVRAQHAHDTLAELVAQAEGDTTTAEADLAQMQAAIDSAEGHLAGQIEALLAIEPGPDAGAIQAGVSTVRAALGSTRSDLRTAVQEGHAVLDFLRAN